MDEEYAEAVLGLAERVPPGRVTTYGLIAEAVRERLGRGGPRTVGQVMARDGGGVPWWRVVRADGSLPECHQGEATRRHTEEGTPRKAGGRVDLDRAVWLPPYDASASG